MSQTFTSNPSRISRGRGADRGGSRGASTASRSSHIGVGARSSIGTSVTVNKASSISQKGQGSRLGQPGTTRGLNASANNTRTGTRGRGRMDYSRNPNLGPSGGANAGQGVNGQEQQNDQERQGQYAGGFTVVPRNEKKWQEINRMAQKETADYERYKQANSAQSFSYVGTVGGGEISQGQARARQAQQVRAAKFNRQLKQEEQRQATKKAEEDAIQAKRADARRKAEQNAQRQARVAPAEEVRRNREAFLAQFEMKSPGNTSTSPQHTSVESPSSSPVKEGPRQSGGGNSNNNAAKMMISTRVSPGKVSSSPTKQKSPRRTQEKSAGSGRSVTHDENRSQQADVKSEPQVFQSRESPDDIGVLQASYGVKTDVKQEGAEGHRPSQMDEEIQILLSMYPDVAPEYLADLLCQMGSLDGAMDVLDFKD